MSKKIHYFIEKIPTDGKLTFYEIKNNKNKKFLTEHPHAKEIKKDRYDSLIYLLKQSKLNANKANTI